jgi:iron complex outermembrane receptor protein
VAISRAVRTPPRIDEGLRERFAQINPAPPPFTFILLTGEPSVKSEILHAYELGYRYEWRQKFSADAVIYYNEYSRLTGLSAPGPMVVNPSPFYIDIPLFVDNGNRGQTHGLELSLKYAPVRRWTLSTEITELRGTSTPSVGFPAVANNPKQQINVQSRLDLTRHLNFDAAFYHYNAISGELPLVNRVDVGVSTKPIRGCIFSVWGRNLQQDRHMEAIPQTILGGDIRRSVVFKLLWEPSDNGGKSGK